MKDDGKNLYLRVGLYFSGLLMLTFGISLTILANLGASPVDALLVGLYNKFGLSVGSWEFILGGILLLANAVVQRRKPEIFAMLTAFITGMGIDFWLFIIADNNLRVTILGFNLLILVLGIGFLCLGISTYLQADLFPSPLDGTMLVIRKYFGVKISTAKNILMVFFLVMAIIFKGPIAIGTVIIVLASGPIIGLLFPMMNRLGGMNFE